MTEPVELSDAARAIIAEGRAGLEPSAADQDRLHNKLLAALAISAGATTTAATAATLPAAQTGFAASGVVVKTLLAVAVVAVAGVFAVSQYRSASSTPTLNVSAKILRNKVSSVEESIGHTTATQLRENVVPQPNASTSVRTNTATMVHDASAHAPSTLAEETAAIARIEQRLRATEYTNAISESEAFARRYPHAQLEEEVAALATIARCLRARSESASAREATLRSALRIFRARHPHSLMQTRVAQACEPSDLDQ